MPERGGARSERASRPRSRPAPLQAPALGSTGGGQALPRAVAAPISASLGVDVSPVRVHTDSAAGGAAQAFGARALTVGPHVFLGSGQRPTDLPLMAHEVAHVVQQQSATAVQLWTPVGGDHYEREAQSAASAVVQRRSFPVRLRTRPRIQRLGISDALDYFADKANLIPGFRMFTILIGINPINMSRVERSAANILRALVELIPGGGLITRALDGYGIFERVGTWVEQRLRTLGITGDMIRQAISRFIDSLSWRDIFRLGSVWDRAKRIFTDPIGRIIDFATSLIGAILGFVREAVLRPLARLAEGTRGYDLLKAVLGQDPITGERVPRTAENLIGGFMKLIGQEEVWLNIKRANAIPRAWAWFQGALEGVMAFVRAIPQTFINALRSLELVDLVTVVGAFRKVTGVFISFVGSFFAWAGRQVLNLLQIIFEVLAPGAMPYLRRAAGALGQIFRNPIRFLGNLVRAGIQGFRQFGSNFLSHLRNSLIQWLTGTLSGAAIYIPRAFEIREIIKFVLSVLGLTWQNIRGKLVRAVGDTAVRALEEGFDIVLTLVREGPAAAWEKIREQLSNLREMVMEQVMSFVRTNIVTAAITRLLTSLNPAGAFIQAVIGIYNTVMFIVERLSQIAQVAMSFIDSMAAIASGAIGAAANRVEQTLAGLLTLVISFLARIVGLGNVSQTVLNIVRRIRDPIDRALDRVVDWIVSIARRVIGAGRAAIASVVNWWRVRKRFRTDEGESHELGFRGERASAQLVIRSQEQLYRNWLNTVPIPAGDTVKAKAKTDAIAATQQIEALKTRNMPDGERTVQFESLLNALAASTRVLLDTKLPKSTPPIYGGRSSGGFATSVDVNVLTKKSEGGSRPKQDLPGLVWESLVSRYEARASRRRFYRLGHLLSYHMGGPGNTWDNLSPQSESGNATFERQAESKVWDLIKGGKKGVRYRIRAVYGRASMTAALVTQWTARKRARIPDLTKVADAEQHVPTKFEYEYQVVWPALESSSVKGEAPNDVRQQDNLYHL